MTWQSQSRRHAITSYSAFSTPSKLDQYTKAIANLKTIPDEINPLIEKYNKSRDRGERREIFGEIETQTMKISQILKQIQKIYFNNNPVYTETFCNSLTLGMPYIDKKNKKLLPLTPSYLANVVIAHFMAWRYYKKYYPDYIIYPSNLKPYFPKEQFKKYIAGYGNEFINGEEMRYIIISRNIMEYFNGSLQSMNKQYLIMILYYILKATNPDKSREQLIKLTHTLYNELKNSKPDPKNKMCIFPSKKYGIKAICFPSREIYGNYFHVYLDENAIEKFKTLIEGQNQFNKSTDKLSMIIETIKYAGIDNAMDDIASYVEEIWDKHYKSQKKYKLINDLIARINEVQNKYTLSFEKKAISTHISKWTGWRHDREGNDQYCLQWYGGYVYCLVFKKRG